MVALGIAVCLVPTRAQRADRPAAAEWSLVWSDEFEGDRVDATKWDFDAGTGYYDADAKAWVAGWGNDELQYYTRRPSNVFVRDGLLHIRAVKEEHFGASYTSARLKTRTKDGRPLFGKTYGRFEFRAKLPVGRGVWPALWMLPQSDAYGGWPCSGEIDVMEARGQEPNKVVGTLHFGARWPANVHVSKEYVFPAGQSIADFHAYAVEWEPGEIRWYVDGRLAAGQSSWWTGPRAHGGKGKAPAGEAERPPWPAPFDRPFYLIMNLAVGGKFLGNPDPTTVFPVEMVVDHVRVYEKVAGYGKARPPASGTPVRNGP